MAPFKSQTTHGHKVCWYDFCINMRESFPASRHKYVLKDPFGQSAVHVCKSAEGSLPWSPMNTYFNMLKMVLPETQ